MPLFLVQHGKKNPEHLDPEKGLSAEGSREVERSAGVLRTHGVPVSEIWHSGKKRARQTADIIAGYLGEDVKVKEKEGLGPLDDVTSLNPDPDKNLLMVGHLPFMERLVSSLVTGSPDHPPLVKFQNGGVVALERDGETGSWYIKWTLFPDIH